MYLHIILYVQQEEGYMCNHSNLDIRMYDMLTDYWLVLLNVTYLSQGFNDICNIIF